MTQLPKQFYLVLIAFLPLTISFASSKVLYNVATREVVTPENVKSGTTDWSLLDAQNSNFSSYSHPAYYSSVVHQVVDSSDGSKVGNWILTTVPKALYNSTTKEYLTPQQIKAGGTDWIIIDANPANPSGHSHPAYYSKSAQEVLDSSQGSQVGQWILSDYSYPSESSNNGNPQDGNSGTVNKVLYNIETKEVITPEEVASGATDWLLLSPAKYPDKYTHPAFYNLTFHRVVENLESDVENGWTLKDPSSVDQNATNPDLAKVLYNTLTQEVITRTQIEAGGSGWIILPPGFVGNDGSTYSFPAYFNQTTNGVLDNTPGDTEANWVLSHLTVSVTASVPEGGTVSGVGNYDLKATVILTASPSAGFLFSSWSGGVEGSLNPISFVAGYDLQATANFARDTNDDDGDGLTNYEELVVHSTNPSLVDTDEDGLSDKEEVLAGMDAKTSNKALIDQIAAAIGSKGSTETPYTEGWFYLPGRGWLFTNKSSYPYLYDNSSNGWLYFRSGGEKPRFYNYGKKAWITIESSQ